MVARRTSIADMEWSAAWEAIDRINLSIVGIELKMNRLLVATILTQGVWGLSPEIIANTWGVGDPDHLRPVSIHAWFCGSCGRIVYQFFP